MEHGMERGAEIWLMPNPWISLHELVELVQNREISATPRYGARDITHLRGYAVGQRAWLQVRDARRNTKLDAAIEVEKLFIRPLGAIKPEELAGCEPGFQSWLDVHKILSYFERRELDPHESVTIVHFTYLD